MFEKIMEDQEVYAFSVGDLTAWDAAAILQSWEAAGDPAPLTQVTVYYDGSRLCINRDSRYYPERVQLVKAALSAPINRIRRALNDDKLHDKVQMQLILRYMEDHETAENHWIVKQQLVHDDPTLERIYREGSTFEQVSDAYNWGVINGKREERARRRRSANA